MSTRDKFICNLFLPLQITGIFPYAWDKDSRRVHCPIFSVKLFLWSIFLSILTLADLYYTYLVTQCLDTTSIGLIMLKILLFSSSSGTLVLPVLGLVKSGHLAFILQNHGPTVHEIFSKNFSGNLRSKSVLIIIFVSIPAVLLTGFAIKNRQYFDIGSIILVPTITVIAMVRATVYMLFFSWMFGLISHTFLKAVIEAVAKIHNQQGKSPNTGTISHALVTQDTKQCQEGIMENISFDPIDSLYELEEKLHEVSTKL